MIMREFPFLPLKIALLACHGVFKATLDPGDLHKVLPSPLSEIEVRKSLIFHNDYVRVSVFLFKIALLACPGVFKATVEAILKLKSVSCSPGDFQKSQSGGRDFFFFCFPFFFD